MKKFLLITLAMILGMAARATQVELDPVTQIDDVPADSVAVMVVEEADDDQMVILEHTVPPIIDSLVIDTTLIAHPQWEFEKKPKHYFLAGAEVVGCNLLFHVLTRYVAQEDYAKISWKSIKNNFKKGFYWDNDRFETNLYSHPFQGSLYYNCARTNGLNFWESAPYALFGSSIWEMFMETQPPSTNDIIATPLGGMALGEIGYRASSLVLRNDATGMERVGRELVAALFNPVRGVKRLISGEMWHKSAQRLDDELAQVPFHVKFGVGYQMLNNRDMHENAHFASTQMGFIYNNPFTMSGKVPFEFFTTAISLNFGKNQPHLGTVNLMASMWAKNWQNKNGSHAVFGIFQHFNYYNTEALQEDETDVPFRIAETVSYGPGFIYTTPVHGNRSLALAMHVSGIVLGGSLSDHYRFQERDYDLGSGFSLHTNVLMALSSRVGFTAGFEHYRLFTWKGYETKDWEHIDPNYLNAMGATGNAWMHLAKLRCTVRLYKAMGLAAEGLWTQRRTHYKYFDDVRSNVVGFRLMLTYDI